MSSTLNAATSGGLTMTSDTSGILKLQTAGTDAVTITAAQNVGIGTSSPSYKFQVAGTIASTGGSSIAVYGKTNSDSISNTFYLQNSDGSKAANLQLGTTGILQTWVYGGSSWVNAMTIDSAGKITDTYGNIRAIPAVGTKTSSYTLATTDVGRYVQVSTGGSIVVPDATFAEGDVVSVFNNTSGTITITCSITTAYIAGTDSDKASMTLAARGVATFLFISGTICVASGNLT